MKKPFIALCIAMVILIAVQSCCFALDGTHITFSQTEADENGNFTVSANSYVTGVSEDNNGRLITAVYDAYGNVVNSNTAYTSGNDKVLKNTVTVSENQVVKTFLWKADMTTPIEKAAVMGYGSAIEAKDVEITFDGVPFSQYVGEDLTFDADHTTEYTVTYEDKNVISIPDVSVNLKDNGLKYNIKEETMRTEITIYGGIRRSIDDPGETNGKYTYSVSGVDYVDQTYLYPLTETVIINYNTENTGYYWTKNDFTFSGSLNGWSKDNVMLYAASKEYNVEEGQTKDITLTLNSPNELSTFLIIKGKDITKDVLVLNKGNNVYTDIPWAVSDPASLSNVLNGVSVYNYRLDADNNRDFSYGFEADRATGVEVYKPTTITTNGSSSGKLIMYGRKTQNNDGDYVTGSALSHDRTPVAGNRMEITDLPDDLLGYNYITMPKAALSNLTFTITVNDNIDSIVMLSLSNASTYSIKDSEDEAVWQYSDKGNYGYKKYLNTTPIATTLYLYSQGFDAEKELSSQGRIIRYNVAKYLQDKGGIAKFSSDCAYSKKTTLNTAVESHTNLGEYYADYRIIGDINAKITVTDLKMAYDEYKAYVDAVNKENPGSIELSTEADINSKNKFMTADFVPHMTTALAGRAGYNQANTAAGALLRYPDYFNLESATYIAPHLGWENTASSFRTYLQSGAGKPIYTFNVKEDCRILIFYKTRYDDSWLETDGWAKAETIPSEESIHIMQDLRTPSAHVYDEVYNKEFSKGDTVTIKTFDGTTGLPLVFVFEK